MFVVVFFFVLQMTAYEWLISAWSSDVCSSDLLPRRDGLVRRPQRVPHRGAGFGARVAAVEPDDVRPPAVTLGQEAAIDRGVGFGELALGRQVAPGGHHRDIDAVRGGAVDHPVDMVPIIIFARPGGVAAGGGARAGSPSIRDRKSTRLNSSH